MPRTPRQGFTHQQIMGVIPVSLAFFETGIIVLWEKGIFRVLATLLKNYMEVPALSRY